MSSATETEIKQGANYLPRGGYIVPTSAGYVQFGSPPETIKDTMRLPEKVPKIFVLPGEAFNVEKGIAVAELEFPIYFNHFLCQEKTIIICSDLQKRQLITVLNESVFGPQIINLEDEYTKGKESFGYPDLKKEMDYFRGDRKLEDLIEFGIYNENDSYQIQNVTIVKKEGKGFEVLENSEKIASIPWSIPYEIKYDIGARLKEPFEAPDLGITCLGPSHGFDPDDNTSGFILWLNRRGVMIDPPVNSTEWLRDSNVSPKLIHHVLLTHCHADHDAGTFQKILEEFSITIHTTETVMDSFMRKYTALTQMSRERLFELFTFDPISVGEPVFIEGVEFIFHYTLHSIPALGFSLRYKNKSFFYSSDHLNHPNTVRKMNEMGIFTETRYDFLSNFSWDYDIIYHEAGIPPLHTPISYLSTLPPDVQEKINVYHIAKKDFPQDSHLHLAKFGIEHTVYPEIPEVRHSEAIDLLDILNNVDLFSNFPLYKAREFLMILEQENFAKGEHIIRKGTFGDKFYIILSGTVAVKGTQNNFEKNYSKYEYFGETSIVNEELRSADVVAATEVVTVTITKDLFLYFVQGTELETELKNLAKIRASNSWDVLSKSNVFGGMTSHQKTQLETVLEYKKVNRGYLLIEETKKPDQTYILVSGEVGIRKGLSPIKTMHNGDFIGDIFSLQKNQESPFSAYTLSDVDLFSIQKNVLLDFLQKNPGVYMRLMKSYVGISDFKEEE